MGNNGDFEADYHEPSVTTIPSLSHRYESGSVSPSVYADMLVKNPWLVDPSSQQTDPYTLDQKDEFISYPLKPAPQDIFEAGTTNNGGLFLDAGIPTSLKPPYYSLSTPKYLSALTLNEKQPPLAQGDWIFRNWSATQADIVGDPNFRPGTNPDNYDTKAVIFHDPAANATAEYKGHLLTNAPYSTTESQCGTCPNSQRKLAWTQRQSINGMYQLVYESMGSIWYTESTDKGQTWTPEQYIAKGTNPSISSTDDETYIAFNCQTEISVMRYMNGKFVEVSPFLGRLASSEAAPVVVYDGGSQQALVVYEDNRGQLSYIRFWKHAYIDKGVIPNTGSGVTPERPSMTYGNGAFMLTWREGAIVEYMEIVHNHPQPPSFSSIMALSNSWQFAEGSPSITKDFFGQPAVTWSSFDLMSWSMVLNFRQRIGGNWGTMARFYAMPGVNLWAQSILTFNNTPQYWDMRIAHNVDALGIGVIQLLNGYWQNWGNLTDGLHPNVTAHVPNFQALEVYSNTSTWFWSSSVHPLLFGSGGLTKSSSPVSLASSRELVLRKDTTNIRIRLGELAFTGSNATSLNWNTGFDTLIVGKTKTVEDYLRSESFVVPSNGALKYRVTNTRRGQHSYPQGMQLRLQVVDAQTQQVLAMPGQITPHGLGQGRQDSRITYPLHQLAGRNVYVRMQLVGLDTTVQLGAIDYYHDPLLLLPKSGDEAGAIQSMPSEVWLEQNYPNPFNPSTEISFSLPITDHVSLRVFDALGREVRVLVDKTMEAGFHSVSFDGRDLPSGIYFYRLNTNGVTLTKRMNLVK